MLFEKPSETPQPVSNEVPKKKPSRLAVVALATSASFSSPIEELPQLPKDEGESALTEKSLEEYLAARYVKAEYGPTEGFTLEDIGESVSDLDSLDPETKRDIMMLSLNKAYPQESDAFRQEAWQKIIHCYGKESVRKFTDFIASVYMKIGKTREEKLQSFESWYLNKYDAPEKLEETFYQIATIIQAGRYDDMQTILESLRTLSGSPTKNLVGITELTPEWLDILSDPEEQKALVFISKTIRMGEAHKIEAAGFAQPGNFFNLRPSEQVRSYIDYTAWRQRQPHKQGQ